MQLAGMLCYLSNTFDLQQPLNLEVSMLPNPKLIPRELGCSWNSIEKQAEIKEWNLKLQEFRPVQCFSVIPLFASGNPGPEIIYYLNNFEEFMSSYVLMGSLIKQFLAEPEEEEEVLIDTEYKADWSLDPVFVKASTLVTKPGEKHNKPRQLPDFVYIWDIPSTLGIYAEQMAVNLVSLFLKECTPAEHIRFVEEPTYLRFFLYKDSPEGVSYITAYIRPISDCTYRSHKLALTEVRKNRDFLPCEINYPHGGRFFEFPRDQWVNKVITFVGSFG